MKGWVELCLVEYVHDQPYAVRVTSTLFQKTLIRIPKIVSNKNDDIDWWTFVINILTSKTLFNTSGGWWLKIWLPMIPRAVIKTIGLLIMFRMTFRINCHRVFSLRFWEFCVTSGCLAISIITNPNGFRIVNDIGANRYKYASKSGWVLPYKAWTVK